jgi:hypothetical protein
VNCSTGLLEERLEDTSMTMMEIDILLVVIWAIKKTERINKVCITREGCQ